jgi:PAS domain S-box-containing protein
MSFGGLRAHQIILFALMVTAVVAISIAWEVGEFTRAAVEESSRDAQYIANSMVRQIQHVVAKVPSPDPYHAVRNDPALGVTLTTATQFAPTVLYVAFCDSTGRAVVHTDPSREGEFIPRGQELPEVKGTIDAWRLLLELQGEGELYENRTPLRMGARSFGTVRVGLGSAFIQSVVNRVVRRGILIGLGQVTFALVAVFLLTRVFLGPLREVRRGIEALRAGDFGYRVPRQGLDEFASMADALNELGDHFRAREEGSVHSRHLQHAIEHLADGLVIIGPDRELIHVNGIAAAHLGLSGEDVLGRTVTEVFADDHPIRRIADEVLGGSRERLSIRAEFARDNGRVPIMAVGHRIDDADDSYRVLIELKDLSALEELQAIMDHSSTLSRLGEMAAGVAHEIRNPLNAITLNLESLNSGRRLDPKVLQEVLATTREQITRLDRAVSGFLKVARLQRLAMSPLCPRRLVREVAELLTPEANLAGLDLVVECDDDVPQIGGDAEVLRQALLNLIKNAIQALPSRDECVIVACRAEKGKVGLSVRDTGPGIDPETLPNIFDLYMTTKEAGTGVGLAFVRQAVEMHRGTVSVDSAPGAGTTMTMWLRAEVHAETHHV